MKKILKFNTSAVHFDFPVVMGILNATPDSFYGKSRNVTQSDILHRAENIFSEGAQIIDIGGFSTRPNATMVSAQEEIRRVSTAIELILKYFPDAVMSVDTFRAEVAVFVCKEYKVHIINDVGGGMWDENMFAAVAQTQAAYILTHTSPSIETMTVPYIYDDIAADVTDFFQKKIAILNNLGVNDIIIDPGFGFYKNVQQNCELFSQMDCLHTFEKPLLVGISRKSMIQKTLGVDADGALNGTTALNAMALVKGADILRVHDVQQAVETVKMYNVLGN